MNSQIIQNKPKRPIQFLIIHQKDAKKIMKSLKKVKNVKKGIYKLNHIYFTNKASEISLNSSFRYLLKDFLLLSLSIFYSSYYFSLLLLSSSFLVDTIESLSLAMGKIL